MFSKRKIQGKESKRSDHEERRRGKVKVEWQFIPQL